MRPNKEQRNAWDRYAAGALACTVPVATDDLTLAREAAKVADHLLQERIKRFPLNQLDLTSRGGHQHGESDES
jgi:hypothetical protein